MEGLGRMAVLVLAAVSVSAPGTRAHSYHVGRCPQLPPKPDFNIRRFLGRWYVVEKTSTKARCLTNEYSWAQSPESSRKSARDNTEWEEEVEEVEAAGAEGEVTLRQRMVLPVPGVNHGVRYTGSLKQDPHEGPGAFRARFPLNLFGSASYVVYDTDYDSYAAVFSCQKIALWHRLSASIMSRKPVLEPSVVHKLRYLLKAHKIDVDNLNVIPQTCSSSEFEKGIQVDIKPQVLNNNVTEILRDTGDVVLTAAEAGKRFYDVYNTVASVAESPASGYSSHLRRKRDVSGRQSILVAQQLRQWLP